ncbi:outer membrane protein assembly factor BamD [Acetobacteraceae bacterium KSS8]|uniref:Outer membrane protein assembly factor BamD n=1 Tax=Endosaccharibacter trunci TaxID=2812733 RepID=A0ABT1W2T3_9PROT|nr:outer membrane protein assembly factor BamD [Acetobacteraceae bacterium KSS8]
MSLTSWHLSRLAPAPLLLGLMAVPLAGCETLDSINPFSSSKAPVAEPAGPPTAEGLYNNGIDALHTKRYKLAVSQFETIQQNFPYSGYTANAQLMEGYAYYLQQSYPDAVQQIDRFLQLHPTSDDAAYAYYLRALCYYEQIADIQRDQQGTVQAMNALQDVVTRFPDTAYARDARLKIDLCRDHLAGKEMLVGRYYERQHEYAAAINRYQRVVQDFQTTNHAAEALARLVEVDLKLGLTDQAHRNASVLGYNYPGSPWYQDAYNNLRSAHALQPSDVPPGQPIGAADTGAPPAATSATAPAQAQAPVPVTQKRGFFGRIVHSVF